MQISSKAGTHKFVVGGSLAAILATLSALVLAPMTLRGALSSPFLPHAYCYLYDKKLIALHVGSDGIIWLSYVAIALTLAYLVWRTRREIPFSWMFLAFGTFIIACGFTHFMEIVVLWKPLYWLAGDVKLLTALASVVTAIALPPLVPQIQTMIKSVGLSEERGLHLEKANDELRDLSGRLLRAQDGERRRIARELHDGVGQYLAAMKMSFDMASSEEEDPAAARESLSDCRKLLERCTMEIRTMSHLLHPPLLEEMGLASAARWYVEGFTERSGIMVELEMPGQFDRLPRSVEMVLFRVLQESLTNIHRHSGSKMARIQLALQARNAILTVQDQGKGFSEPSDGPRMGVGIAGMRERVKEFGGDFKIDSTSRGTTVTAIMPLEEK